MFNFSVFLIALRDFTESFLIIGLLLGFSKKQNLKKEHLIFSGGLMGILASFAVILCVFFVLPFIHFNFSFDTIDTIGHYALIISGLLMIYLTYRIHPTIMENKNIHINSILGNKEVEKISFFVLTFLLVLQEGFEITIFSSTISFLNSFLSNAYSLFLGFLVALGIGAIVYKTYLKNHLKKLFKITEILLIAYGAFLVFHGVSELVGF